MPYKNAFYVNLGFSESEGHHIKQLAEAANVTPYALLKAIVMQELKLKEELYQRCYRV